MESFRKISLDSGYNRGALGAEIARLAKEKTILVRFGGDLGWMIFG
jgi:hypothetical protein